MKKNKKATLDNIYVLVQVFGLAIFLLSMLVAWNYLTDSSTTEKFWSLSATSIDVKNDAQKGINQLDNIYFLVYFGLHLGVLALSFLLRSHPVFLFVIIFFMVIVALIAAPLSNAYNEIILEDEFLGIVDSFPKLNYIMNNLPLFEIIWIFTTGIVLIGFGRND